MRILTFLVFLGLGFIHPVLAQCSKRDRDLPELLIDQVRQARQYVKAGIRRKGDHHRLGGAPGRSIAFGQPDRIAQGR